MKTILQVVPINGVVFPHQTIQLFIPSTSNLFRKNLIGTSLGVCFQKDPSRKNSILSYLTDIGIIIRITDEVTETTKGEPREYKMIRGAAMRRFRLRNFLSKMQQPLSAEVELLPDETSLPKDHEFFKDGVMSRLKDLAYKYIELVPKDQLKARARLELIRSENNPTKLHYIVASYLNINDEEKCKLLEINDIVDRISKLINILEEEIKSHELNAFNDGIKNANFVLHRQNRNQKPKDQIYIEENNQELDTLETKLENASLPIDAYNIAIKEFNSLKKLDSRSPDYHIQKKYIETLAELPWNKKSTEVNNINFAEKVLESSHAGLEKVKERILEFLAVKLLKKDSKGLIICLQGPPGVGKTSLAKSIAESLGRKFERLALGGSKDESEIRGHRRTYVGAMPGRLVQSLIRCQTNNPVVLLDEIDKLGGRNNEGDLSAALLEVLDPNQNHSFKDHYLGVPFNLSNVLFIATSNNIENISPPLLDRMEIISLSGYTIFEKTMIALNYLVPKQIEENGIDKSHVRFSQESLKHIISYYTAEAGVRNLERMIGSICRRVAFDYLKFQRRVGEIENFNIIGCQYFSIIGVSVGFIEEVLGPKKFDNDLIQRIDQPGIAIGLAWTSVGGRVLLVEAAKSSGDGRIEITGQLGTVMKESVSTALGWIKSHPELIHLLTDKTYLSKNQEIALEIGEEFPLEKYDVNLHFPVAAVPKDGPSAGMTIAMTLISLFSNRQIKSDVAMSGEMTLTGTILPVGGIKEKCLAAHSSHINRVILPEGNRKDVNEIPSEIKRSLRIHFVSHIYEAIILSLETSVSSEDIRIAAKFSRKQMNKVSKL